MSNKIDLSKKEFESVFNNAPIGIVIMPINHNFSQVNEAMCKMLGYSRDELLGKNFKDITHPDDIQTSALAIKKIIQGHIENISLEKRYVHKNGSVVWGSVSVSKIEKSDPATLIAYIKNITQGKFTEENLRKSQEQLQSILDNTTAVIYIKNTSGKYIFANKKYEELFHISREKMVGQTDYDIFEPHIAEAFRINDQKVIKDNSSYELEEYAPVEGKIHTYISTKFPLYDEKGNIYAVCGISTDITKQKQTLEKKLRIKEQAIESTFTPMYFTIDKKVTEVNKALLELWGYQRSEVLNKDSSFFWKDKKQYQEIYEIVTKEGKWAGEIIAIKKNSDTVHVHFSMSVVTNDEGQVICKMASVVDISKRKQTEQKLKKAKENAEVANYAKSIFLTNISHELRTPLNAILGFTQILNRQCTSPKQREDLNIIQNSGDHLLTLINQLIDLSKMEVDQLKEKDFDLYNLLNALEKMFSLKAGEKQLELLFECANDIPQYICTDEEKLRQVLIHLLHNALKFTKQGKVTLQVTQHKTSSATYLHFEVEDTGSGVSPEEIENLFQTFSQTRRYEVQEGLGLGLSISRKFVQLMGGDITVKSQVGQGTTILFNIKVQTISAKVITPAPFQRVIALQSGQPCYRILVADNIWSSRQFFLKLLRPLGFELHTVKNGQEAIEICKTFVPHLIWMNMQMPVIDGYEVTKHIKQSAIGKDTKIIALLTSIFKEKKEKILSAGCDDFILRPFKENDIFELMNKHIKVQYVYKEQEKLPAIAPLNVNDLAAIPNKWLAELKQGTEDADISLLFATIEKIRKSNDPLANALYHLVNNFEYAKLAKYLEQNDGI